MKKIVSAILILLLLFNWFGYNLVADYIQQKADKQLEARLDENSYDEARLIALKIPLNLAYQTTWSDSGADFERYDGEIKMNGILYKYVKRKVVNDTLVLMCIPNSQKMQLETAKSDFFKYTNDLASNNGSKRSDHGKGFACKKISSDYDDHAYICKAGSIPNNQPLTGLFYLSAILHSSPRVSPEQPPDSTGA